MTKIKYDNNVVPSWSWIACSGLIEFVVSIGSRIETRTSLLFEGNQQHALSAVEVASFMDCKLKGGQTTELVEKGRGKIVWWIRYDILDDIPEFNIQRCIVVGRTGGAKEKFHVLVVI